MINIEAKNKEKNSNWRNSLKLIGIVRPYLAQIFGSFGAGLVGQVLTIGGAAIGAYMVGAAASGAKAGDLWPGLVVLLLIVASRAGLSWVESWLGHDLAYRVLAALRLRVYRALDELAPAYLTNRRTGNVISTAMKAVENLEVFYAHILGSLAIALLVPTGVLIGLAFINIWLVLALLPWLILEASVPLWFSRRARQQGEVLEESLSDLNADMVDGVQGLRELAIWGRNDSYLEKLKMRGQTLRQAQIKYAVRNSFEKAADATIMALGAVCVLLVAGLLASSGQLRFDLYPLSVVLAANSFGPIAAFNGVAGYLGLGLAAADTIFDILHTAPTVTDRVASSPPRTGFSPLISFEAVTFRYAADRPDVLQRLSFAVQPGETVALVGPSGAGKSTCGQLLLRFWDVQSGTVQLGGHALPEYRLADLRELIAVVPQETYLFNISLMDNIRLGKPNASLAEVEAAACAAFAHDFIVALPQGYDTLAGERGLQLSGGQRQRIAIARALLKDAPVLWMDEAVSNLDTESEKLIQAALTRLRQGRTTLVIAHRLSTILSADRIIVLKAGQVVESGTHAELMAQAGIYADLIATQLEVQAV